MRALILSLLGLLGVTVLSPRPAAALQTPWPEFFGQVGAYDVQTTSELEAMASHGFHFALLGATISHSPGVSTYNIKYIDEFPQWQVWVRCRSEIVSLGVCSSSSQTAALDSIQTYLDEHFQDRNMIGYWLLDDSPGTDIRQLLRRIHTLIVAANKKADFPRPAICAFNSVESLRNYDPIACDMVALYLYSRNGQNAGVNIDWTLSQRLPEMINALKERGWDPKRAPLIGIPQAFSYPGREYATPKAKDLASQSEAFCRAGAIALLAYAWHDGFQGDSMELYNTPSLVLGLQQGRDACREKWWHSGPAQ